jgi:hypothetical protein
VAVLYPQQVEISLGVPSSRANRSHSGSHTPPSMVAASMSEGSPSQHTLTSHSPPPPPPLHTLPSSYIVFEPSPRSVNKDDMSSFWWLPGRFTQISSRMRWGPSFPSRMDTSPSMPCCCSSAHQRSSTPRKIPYNFGT